MDRRSQKALASMPTAAVVWLLLALGSLTTRATAAPYVLVANVVSHFVVHDGGNTLLKQPQIDVQCSALPGVQCRTLIQNNRLIINVYQDNYMGESAESFKETHEDVTIVPTMRWYSSKPDRMSRKPNVDTTDHDAELTSTQHVDVFESDNIQDESLQQTSQDDGTENTDDYRGESAQSFKETHEDNTVVSTSRQYSENSEEVMNQVSELEDDEEQSEDHEYNEVSQIPRNDNNELLNDNNTSDDSKGFLKFSRSGKSEESKSSIANNHFGTNNENEQTSQEYEENSEGAYGDISGPKY